MAGWSQREGGCKACFKNEFVSGRDFYRLRKKSADLALASNGACESHRERPGSSAPPCVINSGQNTERKRYPKQFPKQRSRMIPTRCTERPNLPLFLQHMRSPALIRANLWLNVLPF